MEFKRNFLIIIILLSTFFVFSKQVNIEWASAISMTPINPKPGDMVTFTI